jgi:hypothetical protein
MRQCIVSFADNLPYPQTAGFPDVSRCMMFGPDGETPNEPTVITTDRLFADIGNSPGLPLLVN